MVPLQFTVGINYIVYFVGVAMLSVVMDVLIDFAM